jgi:hypothetical protein
MWKWRNLNLAYLLCPLVVPLDFLHTIKVSVKSPCLHLVFQPPNPSFSGIRKVMKFY